MDRNAALPTGEPFDKLDDETISEVY